MTEGQGDAGYGWAFAVGAGFIVLLLAALVFALMFALLGLRLPWF